MSGESLKRKAQALGIDPKSQYAFLQKLIVAGSFDLPISSDDVVRRIKERFGKRWQTNRVQTYMRRFMDADIVHAVKPVGHARNYWVLSSVTREQALLAIGKKKRVHEIETELFSAQLMRRLKKDFGKELEELKDNFGKNGNCTAFLLRNILEKLLIIVFAKTGNDALLEDKRRPGGWVGLKEMLEIAVQKKLGGVPILLPRTANEIKG